MIRGFVEYKVRPDQKEHYIRVIAEIRRLSEAAGLRDYSVCESVEQENLFVETFLVESMEEYRQVEANLSKNQTILALREELEPLIVGGSQAKKIWFFTELQFS
jgi:L-rhamnose mutarotase